MSSRSSRSQRASNRLEEGKIFSAGRADCCEAVCLPVGIVCNCHVVAVNLLEAGEQQALSLSSTSFKVFPADILSIDDLIGSCNNGVQIKSRHVLNKDHLLATNTVPPESAFDAVCKHSRGLCWRRDSFKNAEI